VDCYYDGLFGYTPTEWETNYYRYISKEIGLIGKMGYQFKFWNAIFLDIYGGMGVQYGNVKTPGKKEGLNCGWDLDFFPSLSIDDDDLNGFLPAFAIGVRLGIGF